MSADQAVDVGMSQGADQRRDESQHESVSGFRRVLKTLVSFSPGFAYPPLV